MGRGMEVDGTNPYFNCYIMSSGSVPIVPIAFECATMLEGVKEKSESEVEWVKK